MSAKDIYKIDKIDDFNWKHIIYAKNDDVYTEFKFPFNERITEHNPKNCILCDNKRLRRSIKRSLLCKKCKEENFELFLSLRKAKYICAIGTTSNQKLNKVKEKTKNTNIEKYGVENPMLVSAFKEKNRNTNIEKYGVENVFQSEKIKEKIKKSNRKKYGVDYPIQIDFEKRVKKKQYNKYGMSFEEFKQQWLKEYHEHGLKYCKDKYDLSDSHILKHFIPEEDKQKSTSLNEKIINETIQIDFETNVRKILPSNSRLEIDLLNREHMISIEFNGVYWHQYINMCQLQDLSKAEEMRGIGYRHFALDETDMVKLKLLNKMINPNKTKLYARKLSLKVIKNPKRFLDENHLQGSVRAKIAYGLFLDDELIQTMTFGKSRFDKIIDWEILRLCTKPNYLVVGGAERLFKAFTKKYNPKSVVSYSDNKYFDGKVYGKLGLEFIENTASNYVWWKNGISLKRYQTMKHKLKDILGDKFDPALTEKENMENNGWRKVKDLGNKKWLIKSL